MLQIDFSGKLAAVTGGASGIGRATVDLLRECGARVIVLDRDETTLVDLRKSGIDSCIVDVTTASSIKAAFDKIGTDFGDVDVLVNSAGIMQRPLPAEALPEKEWDRTIDTNLKGTFLCCAHAGAGMARRGRGSIVNVASVHGLSSGPVHAYGPAKAGVINLTQNLAAEWGRRGVRVNAVAPGFTDTPPVRLATAARFVSEKAMQESSAMGRILAPRDVAVAIAFLASELAAAITGVTLPVDAGYLVARTAYGGVPTSRLEST